MGASVFSCWLLVSGIPLFSFKIAGRGIKANTYRLLLVASAAVLLPLFSVAAIPVLIGLYVLLSIVSNYRSTSAS
jgi:CDP-diacylglycerol--serine O-phosphatidyltransferase